VREAEVQRDVAPAVHQLVHGVEDGAQHGVHLALGQLAAGRDGRVVALHGVEALLLDGVLRLRLERLLLAGLAQQAALELGAHDEARAHVVAGLVERAQLVAVGVRVVLERGGVLRCDVEGEGAEVADVDVLTREHVLLDERAERVPHREDGLVRLRRPGLVLREGRPLLHHLDYVVDVQRAVGLRDPRGFHLYGLEA